MTWRASEWRRVALVLSLAALGSTACGPDPATAKGASDSGAPGAASQEAPMGKNSVIRAVRELPADARAERELAERISQNAREEVRAVVELTVDPDARVSQHARSLVFELEDLAIVPLLEAAPGLAADPRVQAVTTAADAELALRARLIAAIDAMLDDRTPLAPPSTRAAVEVPPPERRVCDAGYLLMRRVVHFGEDELERVVAADAFLDLPEAQRDAAIAEARRTGTWQRLVTGRPPDEGD